MKVAVYGRTFDKSFLPYIQDFFHNLNQYGFQITVYQEFFDFMVAQYQLQPPVDDFFSGNHDLDKNIDLVISIGGDGTFLDTVSLVRDSNIPVIGINSGKLGFLANIAKEDIADAVEALCYKRYTTEKRTLLQMHSEESIFPDFHFALNDMTIQKKDSQMIAVHVYLNGSFLNSYWADGLIIATPTGSTAYSLSVGGPIVLPETQNFIISPISPHNLTVRPIIVSDDSEILLKPEGDGSKYLISMDHHSRVIDKKMTIGIRKADFSMNVLQLNNTNFYTTLRNKLMWGIDKRNYFV